MPVLIFLVLILIVFGTTAYAGVSAAPWIPTRAKDVRRILDLAEIKPGERVVDLGCGDGRLPIAADLWYGANARGVDISLPQFLHAWIAAKLKGARRTTIAYRSLFKEDLSGADVVIVFLMSRVYSRLKPKLELELKAGARVLVEAWPIPGWVPAKVDRVPDRLPVYVYVRK